MSFVVWIGMNMSFLQTCHLMNFAKEMIFFVIVWRWWPPFLHLLNKLLFSFLFQLGIMVFVFIKNSCNIIQLHNLGHPHVIYSKWQG